MAGATGVLLSDGVFQHSTENGTLLILPSAPHQLTLTQMFSVVTESLWKAPHLSLASVQSTFEVQAVALLTSVAVWVDGMLAVFDGPFNKPTMVWVAEADPRNRAST